MTREGREFLARSSTSTVARLLTEAWDRGITSKEAEAQTGQHHGKISAALSRLHEENVAARLEEKRDGHSVYVLLEHKNGRTTIPRRYQSQWEEVPQSVDVPADRTAEILARRTSGTARQTAIPFAGPSLTVTRHLLHEAVYHAVTTERPAGMSKTTAHQLAGRIAATALTLIEDQ